MDASFMNNRLSVIIPAHNSAETIENCLKAIKQSLLSDYDLAVIDDASDDDTAAIAARYADKVITLPSRQSRSRVRQKGAAETTGDIIVNIDSDVVIKPDTLLKVKSYFSEHPDVDALTGLLSKDSPYLNFFSQYKTLYMHYTFKKLPQKVTFLYGSIYAVRRRAAFLEDGLGPDLGEDTSLGQKLNALGRKIAFLNDLEVIHLKRYDFLSFIKNDFAIPFNWAKIFLRYKGWRQFGSHGVGFAHSPKGQIISLLVAPASVAFVLCGLFKSACLHWASIFLLIWLGLNLCFISFLAREKGVAFAAISVFVTFFDHLIMAFGVFAGAIAYFLEGKNKWRN